MLERLKNGTILKDRYKVAEVVGQGGMGNVYQAEDLRLPGRQCAIKEVQPEPNASPETHRQEQAQFLREASLLAQLDHPNLPKVSDFFTDGGRDYLVMDYVPGSNLKEMIDDSRVHDQMLDVDVVMDWSSQIIDAVEYLHNQDPVVLHRDIKPANIKITPDGRIKLVDFGLAKVMVTDSSSTITVIQGRGTAYYTPIEQYGAESEHTDIRSDIYALGATLYHLYACQAPPEARKRFLNPTVMQPVQKINPEVSNDISEGIHWALEMHPDNRPKNVGELRQALLGQIRRQPVNEYSGESPNLGEALRSNSLIIFAALILLILAIVITVI